MKKDKIAFITGASEGVGKAIAMSFAKKGYRFIYCPGRDKN